MCGIAGIVNFGQLTDFDHAQFSRLFGCINHRGPDAEGVAELDSKCLLGHKRLSIIDLTENGNQPMSYSDKWIVYNGEIYNFQGLKDELIQFGYKFTSTSDTEVILKLFDKYGARSFSMLKGMFAIAIWDNNSKKLYLARDRISIKPLYYGMKDGILYFGSEVKQFKATGVFQNNPDWKILFLTFGSIPFSATTLEGVNALMGGSYLTYSATGMTVDRFNEVPIAESQPSTCSAAFANAVKTHMVSDAPLGVFLSGGIDSSVLAIESSKYKRDLKTLSVTWGEGDESSYQNSVSKLINSSHSTYNLNLAEFESHFHNFFEAMDQPTVDGINTYFISLCAKKDGLKTVISGVGGDELAFGYRHYHRFSIYETLMKLGSFSKVFGVNTNLSIKFDFLRYPISKKLMLYLLVRGLYSPKWVARILGISTDKIVQVLNDYFNSSGLEMIQGSNLEQFNIMEREIYLKSQLLKDTDFMGMYHSLEIRVPFLDMDFYNCMLKIPVSDRFNRKINKKILIDLVDNLPRDTYMRPKQGFTLPFDSWLRSGDFISSTNLENYDDLKQSFMKGSLHWSKIWAIMCLQEH